jgi:ubiquinone biosynthesis protein UbiJ
MLHALQTLAATAVMERLVLLLNHVLAAEPAATTRLRAHSGRCMQLHFNGWPSLLPTLPVLAFCVTPAGLLEWSGTADPAALGLRIDFDASNPAAALARGLLGERPRVEIAGDAGFAADVSWLFDNLRWDVQDDLAKIIGNAAAHELARIAKAIAGALRSALRSLDGLVAPAAAGSP